MIVRILGEGQLQVPDSAMAELNELDNRVTTACEGHDQDSFSAALAALLGKVREVGSPVAGDTLEPSELVLPPADSSIAEVSELLTEEGLIPG